MANNIKFRILVDNVTQAVGKTKLYTNVVAGLGRTTNSTSGAVAGFNRNIQKTNMQLTNLTKDANRAASGMGNIGGALKSLIGVTAIYQLANQMAKFTQSTIDMIEVANLFSVSMGEMTTETDKFVQSMHEGFGLDVTNVRSAVGTFGLLSRSMGMSTDQSKVLATNTAQLANDLASLVNVPINQVMQDLRSGLVGQSETMYKYGVDVTEASLKQEALIQGITKSVRNMSQGEKMALRYGVMLRQTALAQGDFARTINTPANQLKILGDRFTSLGRAIGAMFIPALQAILPVLNAILYLLTEMFNKIAMLFGYQAPKVTNDARNNFVGVEDGAEDAAGGIDKATDALKAMKDVTSGMDELNIIKPPEAPDAGAGAGGAGGGSILEGLDLTSYDNLLGKFKGISDELINKIKPVLEWMLANIGGIILAMGIAQALKGLAELKLLMQELAALNAGQMLAPMSKHTMGIWEKWKNIKAMLPWIIIGAAMYERLVYLYQNSPAFQVGLKIIGETIKNIAGWISGELYTGLKKIAGMLGLAELFQSIADALSNIGIDGADAAFVIAGLVGLMIAPPLGAAILAFEAFSLAIRAVGNYTSPAIQAFMDLNTGIKDLTTSKLTPFIDDLNTLDLTLDRIDYENLKIDDSVVSDIATQAKKITEVLINELSADKNETLKTLDPLKNFMSEDQFNALNGKLTTFYDNTALSVATGEKRINEIMTLAHNEGRTNTDVELAEIQGIKDKWQNIGVQTMSAGQNEYLKIMARIKTEAINLSIDQASGILQNAKKTKDESIVAALEQYDGIVVAAEMLREAGTINEEEYTAMITAAKTAKTENIQSANEQYNGIRMAIEDKLPGITTYVDTQTGIMKTKWDVVWGSLEGSVRTYLDNVQKANKEKADERQAWWDANMLTFWDDHVAPWFTKEKWTTMMDGVGLAFQEVFRNACNLAISKINDLVDWLNITLKFKWEALSIAGKEIYPAGEVQLVNLTKIPPLARGGMLEAGALFQAGEAGAELIGNYNNKTTVMPLEDSGFVEAIYNAVLTAMTQADGGGKVIENVVNIDGDVIYRNQQQVASKRGVNFGLGVFTR